MQQGKINVTTENIFPIIKKFLYSDHDIFLREIVSNAVDATQKLKTLARVGDFTNELGDTTIRVFVNKENKTITVSDAGLGLTQEEVEKYINQIAFSSAEEFVEKYKDKAQAMIGHFGLGFYSAFMVSKKVELVTLSYKENAEAVKWSCDGSPSYLIEPAQKASRGTDIIMYVDDESVEFLEESKIEELLKKYCKFLPVTIAFGKEKEWKEDKYVDTDKDKIINNTEPAWTKSPTDLKPEDYDSFYNELYPMQEKPLFNIHLFVDYPFNLTGILYFPKIRNRMEMNKNKIQLYCNQVFVTDSVEGIVPEFLTLLHGVIDSPDIPLNISRSYLQSDANVKKISGHITKKVADKLQEIFKNDRKQFEEKWDDLKIFIEYGILSDEKFYERAEKFALLKNVDGKFFTFEEYDTLIKENQTDKNNKKVYLYATDKDAQFSFIEKAKEKGYDVLIMDGYLDAHFINYIESKLNDARFTRVDSDTVERLIEKTDSKEEVTLEVRDALTGTFEGVIPTGKHFIIMPEKLAESADPVIITQSEFMRRMKEMSALGGGASFYGELPDSFNLVVNTEHRLVKQLLEEQSNVLSTKIVTLKTELAELNSQLDGLNTMYKDKKEEEIPQTDKDLREDLRKKKSDKEQEQREVFKAYGRENSLTKQLFDLALLANNMLKGEDLAKFVKRSIQLI